jgi:hypothetical protein
MQDQLDLQYAALECYRSVAETLPAELNLNTFNFNNGRRLSLSGTASPEARTNILSFNDDIRKVVSKNQPLFSNVEAPRTTQLQPGAPIQWNFTCDLKRTEIE